MQDIAAGKEDADKWDGYAAEEERHREEEERFKDYCTEQEKKHFVQVQERFCHHMQLANWHVQKAREATEGLKPEYVNKWLEGKIWQIPGVRALASES